MVDEAVVDLMLWVEGKAAERKIGKASEKQPGKGQAWVPKYASIADILAEYEAPPEPETIGRDEMEALVAALEADAPAEF